MAIEAGLAAKVIAGVGVAGLGTTALYFGGDYISNSLSKYEKALIDFLNAKGDYDFAFEIKKEGGTEDFSESDLKIGTDPKKVSVLAKVQVKSGTNSLFKKAGTAVNDSDKEFEKIKSLKPNQDWTWECVLEFKSANNGSTEEINSTYKERIFKDTNKGLLGILKKDLSNYTGETGKWTRDELRQVKIDFIKQCGHARGVSNNKKINAETNTPDLKITVPPFEFIKKGNASDLTPKYEYTFDYWFKDIYATKEYKN